MDEDQYAPIDTRAISEFDFVIVTALCTDDKLRKYALAWPGYKNWHGLEQFDFAVLQHLLEPYFKSDVEAGRFAGAVDMNSLYKLAKSLDEANDVATTS